MKIYRYNFIILALFLALFSLESCQSKSKKHAEKEGKHEKHDEHEGHQEGAVKLTEDQVKSLGIKLGKITENNIHSTLQLSGNLELPPQSKAFVTPYLEGVVNKVLVQEGEYVKKGQKMAYLSQPEFIHIQDEYLSMYNQLKYQKKEYKRKKKLYEEQITSGRDFQNIEAEYFGTKTKVDALEEKLKLLNLSPKEVKKGHIAKSASVLAPISGYVTAVYTNIGKHASTEHSMFEIVNNDSLYLDLLVYENDINKVKVGQVLHFTIANNSSERLTAKIYAINQAFERQTKAVKVLAKITKNKEQHLIAGMYVNASVDLGDKKVPTLPKDAIISDNGKDYIFALKEKHEGAYLFEKIEIIKGKESNNLVEVKAISSLPKSTKIVLNKAYYLIAELEKSETSHSH